MEYIIQTLIDFFAGIMGEKRAKQYLPAHALHRFSCFILFSNYSGLLPYVRAPAGCSRALRQHLVSPQASRL
jgi:F0F1-type ATP synthase membrane subunit a